MGQVVRAPRFVPRPPVDQLWFAESRSVALVLLALLAPPTYPLEGTRQFHPGPDQPWGTESQPTPQVLAHGPIPFNRIPAWEFNHDASTWWVGAPRPVPEVLLWGPLNYSPLPFRQFNVDLSSGWTGFPRATPPVLAWGPLPYFPPRFRQIDPVPDTPSVQGPRANFPILQLQAAIPFHNRPWTIVDQDIIPTRGAPANFSILQIAQALPFHNRPWTSVALDFPPAPGPRPIPLVVTQLPARPPAAVRGVRVAPYDDPALPWAMGGKYSVTLYIPAPLPGPTLIQRTLTGVGI